MNVYMIIVVEKMGMEFYFYLYPLQENGIQHELYNGEEKKRPSFIPSYVQPKVSTCSLGVRHIGKASGMQQCSEEKWFLSSRKVYWERQTMNKHVIGMYIQIRRWGLGSKWTGLKNPAP